MIRTLVVLFLLSSVAVDWKNGNAIAINSGFFEISRSCFYTENLRNFSK